MALSSIHDVANHGNAVTQNIPSNLEHVVIDEDKHFRPNPDAKPFFPNPLTITAAAPGNLNLNSVVPHYWINSNPEHHENLVVGPASGTSLLKKQHIAFHLVSNLLDDELPDEKDHLNAGFPNSPRLNMYEQGNEQNQGWQTNNEPLNLPLEMVKANVENSSINNKSIHEIWSPDPSPNGLSSVSPTEEINPYISNQQQQQGDSADNSFEQTMSTEIESPEQQVPVQQQQPAQLQQPYSPNVYEDSEGNRNGPTSPSQFYYPPPPQIYHQQYMYRGMAPSAPHRVPEMYPASVHPGRENMMTRPVMYGPAGGYYGPPSHYNNKYPHHHHQRQDEVKYRPKFHGRPPPHHHQEVLYEVKMSYLEELGISLDECRDQLRHLERDYKKADLTLSRDFRLRKSSMGDVPSSKYPPNSTRVDKLITDQLKEHQKVESLIGRIERLGFTPMHPNVGVSLDSWLASVKELRNTRKNEIASVGDHAPSLHYGLKSQSQADVCNLIKSVKDVTKHTRSARTVVWCSVQMLYANCTTPSGD